MGRNRYSDLLDLPHPNPQNHLRMTRSNRAAQFAPFAALTGYDAVIRETGRLTESFVKLSEERKEELNEVLQQLRDRGGENPEVTITYFQPDERKSGGAYVTITGKIKHIDEIRGMVTLKNQNEILINMIVEMETALPDIGDEIM